MKMQTPAQLANDAAVNDRFKIQGFDPHHDADTTSSVFDLSSAPPLQKHTSTAEIFMEVQHFVPTRFEDQMKFMMTIEANRKKFLAERRKAKELLSLGLASADLRKKMFGRKPKQLETDAEAEVRRLEEEQAAQEENRLFALYELHEDRKFYNKSFVNNYQSNQLHKAHHFAEKYIDKCDIDDMEVALRQNVIALRAMGKGIGKKGRDCEMWVEEARGNDYNVLQPKVLPDDTTWLKRHSKSPFSPSGLGHKKQKKNKVHHRRTLRNIQTKHTKRALRKRQQHVALNRRVVTHSLRKLPALL